MNDSARAILHTGLPADGKTPLSVYNRSQTLLDTVEKAIAEGGAHAGYECGRTRIPAHGQHRAP